MHSWTYIARLCCASLLVPTLLLAPNAHADSADEATRTAARALGYAGVDAFQSGDYAGAHERLEKAFALLKAPSLGLWSARALVELGRLVEANERYREVRDLDVSMGDSAVQKQAQQDAAREVVELATRIPDVRLSVVGAPASEIGLSVDARRLPHAQVNEPIALDPGRHVIEAQHGEQTVRTEIVLEEGQQEIVELRFADTQAGLEYESTAATGRPWGTLGWVSLALGGVGLTAGAVAGISLLADRSHFNSSDNCELELNTCGPNEQRRVQAYNTKRLVSGASLIAGGVLAATGAYLVFFQADSESPHVALIVAPDSVLVHGRF